MDLNMVYFSMDLYLEMNIDKLQHRVVMSTYPLPILICLLIFLGCQARVKFPQTGPSEIMWLDMIIACAMAYVCWKRITLINCWRMTMAVLFRSFLMIILGYCVYKNPDLIHHSLAEHLPLRLKLAFCAYVFCVTMNITATIRLLLNAEVRERLTWETFRHYLWKVDVTRHDSEDELPEYHEVMSPMSMSLPPSYEQAIASRPPGHTPTSTPPVTTPITMNHTCVRFNSYQSQLEEETMF